MLPFRFSSSMMLLEWLLTVFIVFQGVQGAPCNCSVSICSSVPTANGSTCYSFTTASGSNICAPGLQCSSLDTCASDGSGCSSTSVCAINTCCASPVCIPSSSISTCTVQTTTTSTSASSTCKLPGAWILATYNLVTLSDLSTSSDVDNLTLVCGSLVSGSSANFANHVTQGTSTALIYSIEVNGQIVSGNSLNVNAGSFGVGTNPTHTIETNGSPVGYTLDGRAVNMNGGNQGAKINVDTNLAAKCTNVTTSLQTLSSYLATLASTPGNTVSIPTSQPGPLNFNVNAVDANGFAVFNFDGNTLLNNPSVQQIQLNVGSSVTNTLQLVIINLSGTSITYGYSNFVGNWFGSITTGRAQTIWNFPQATSLTLKYDFTGAILAPYATVNTQNDIEGSAAVYSMQTTAELHVPPFRIPTCH